MGSWVGNNTRSVCVCESVSDVCRKQQDHYKPQPTTHSAIQSQTNRVQYHSSCFAPSCQQAGCCGDREASNDVKYHRDYCTEGQHDRHNSGPSAEDILHSTTSTAPMSTSVLTRVPVSSPHSSRFPSADSDATKLVREQLTLASKGAERHDEGR